MPERTFSVTNLELRESNPDGSEGAGLAHVAEGMVLLYVRELAADGEPRGGATIVHDAGDYGGRYEALAHALADDGWMVSLPDLRGHGASEGERGHSWGSLEVARDLASIQDHLAYMDPVSTNVVVGQGLGGLHALAYALDHPGRVDALVLLAPLLEPPFEPPRKKGGLMGMFHKLGPTSAGSLGYGADAISTDPAEQRAWSEDRLTHDAVTLRAAESYAETARRVAAALPTLDVPMLVLHGAADRVADPERSRALARGGVEVDVLEGVAHDVLHHPGAERTIERVREWLDRALPR